MFVVSATVDLLRFITVMLFCLGDSYLLLNRGFFSPCGNSALWLIRSYTIQIKLLIKAESCAPFTPGGGDLVHWHRDFYSAVVCRWIKYSQE